MDELFQNKYRVKSTRLYGKDYSDDGLYFVTICTKDRKIFFGNIVNSKMTLNNIGKIVAEEWQKTEKIRDGVRLGEWIIMPNHVHGIIIIEQNYRNWVKDGLKNVNMVGGEFDRAIRKRNVETLRCSVSNETPQRGVSTARDVHHKPQWKSNSLGSIVNQIKSICTKKIRKINPHFAWQAGAL